MRERELVAKLTSLLGDGGSGLDNFVFRPELLATEKLREAIGLCRNALAGNDVKENRSFSGYVSRMLAELLIADSENTPRSIEEAINACQYCLEVFDKQTFPRQYGIVNGLLGLAYLNLRRGNRQENAEAARAHFLMALDVLARDGDRCTWAKVCHNLGSLHTRRRMGDRAANTEMAIRYCEMALDVFCKEDEPVRWGVMQSDLGLAYVASDATEDSELAIEHLNQAVAVLSEHRNRRPPAMFLGHAYNRLGMAYSHRKSTAPDQDTESAIAHFATAVAIFTELSAHEACALAQYELAKEYLKPRSDGSLVNLDRAVALLRAVLEPNSGLADEKWRANARFALARALCRRNCGDREDDLRVAVQCYQESLKVFRRNPSSVKSAIAERELAAAEARLASIIAGNREA